MERRGERKGGREGGREGGRDGETGSGKEQGMGGGKREGGRERGKGACVRETKSQLRIAVSTSTVYPTRYAFHTLNGPSKYSVYKKKD